MAICPFVGVVEVPVPPEETPKGFVRVKDVMLEVANVAWPNESNLVTPFNWRAPLPAMFNVPFSVVVASVTELEETLK